MAIDYSQCALPKGTPKQLDADARKAETASTDKRESHKARKRARGQCEVSEDGERCLGQDAHTHHLISGIGRRNRGHSILAAYKLRVCQICHREIHGKVLVTTTAEHTAATVRYRRVKAEGR